MNQGLPRRLYSLSGVVPLGAYVLIHIWVTASIGSSLALYDRQVGFLHGGVLLGLLEIVLVLVPLAYHAVYGIIRSLQPHEAHAASHGYDNDLMLTLQRASGIAVLVFVVLHVWEFRGHTWTGGLPVGSYSTKLVEDLSSTTWGIPWIALGYLAGIAATLFHLVSGMSSFCRTWGYATSPGALRRARVVFRATGILFFLISSVLVVQLATGARLFSKHEPSRDATCGETVPSALPALPAPPR